MRLTLRTLLLMGAAILTSTTAYSQAQPTAAFRLGEIDLAATYNTQRDNLTTGQIFWQQGGEMELSASLYRGLGFAASVAGSRSSNILGTGVNLTLVTVTFGPHYTWTTPSRRLAFSGQALVGEAHGMDSIFPTQQGALTSSNSLALQLGGGVDWRLNRRFAIRALQIDWIHSQLPNATTNVQNNLRIGAGIVLRLRR